MVANTADFTTVWTDRTVNKLRRNSLFLNLGNRSSESALQDNERYGIRDNTITVTQTTRSRDGGTGALPELTAAAADSGDVEWFHIGLVDSHVFTTREDQRNIPRMRGIDLASMREEMTRQAQLWVDDVIAREFLKGTIGTTQNGTTITPVPPATTAGTVTGGVTVSRTTGRLTGGNNSQENATADSLIAWLEQVNLDLAILNARPNVGSMDMLTASVVMPVPLLFILSQRLRELYQNTDRIVLDGLTQETRVFGGSAWRGMFDGVTNLYVTNAPSLYPSANTGAGAAASNLFRALALVERNTFDAALLTYPARTSPPSGTSAKWYLQQEMEVGFGIVNGNSRGVHKAFTLPASS